MRITLHLDTFDADPCAYAILWLDDNSLKWSREAHAGLTLPEWGILRTEPNGTLICGPGGMEPLCALDGLTFGNNSGPFEGEAGRACWHSPECTNRMSGHWHVQCLDGEHIDPESSMFADNRAA